jgi:hypothetical protein
MTNNRSSLKIIVIHFKIEKVILMVLLLQYQMDNIMITIMQFCTSKKMLCASMSHTTVAFCFGKKKNAQTMPTLKS